MGMQLIETIEVGAGGAASIEFTGIPQDGVDLVVVISSRSDAAFAGSTTYIQFNAVTTGYSTRYLLGTGASVLTSSQSWQGATGVGNSATASTFSNSEIYIPNYTSTQTKISSSTGVAENNSSSSNQGIYANTSSITDAVTSIKLYPNSGSYVEHSTASLYKITAD